MKLAVILLAGWMVYAVVRLLFIFPWTPLDLVVEDEPEPCDVIVFLAGEYYERIDHAFGLAEKGYSSKVFAATITYAESERHLGERLAETSSHIEFFRGRGASSTYEEALGVKEYVDKEEIASVMLVTSSYHSLRAAWVFRRVMPDVRIVSAPVPVRPDERYAGTSKVREDSRLFRYLQYEQQKLLAYYLMYGLNPFNKFSSKRE